MIQFANAKINIGLQIIDRRPDGYHNLETVFYPIPLYDVVEIIRSDQIRFFPTGLPIAGAGPGDDNDNNNNLCLKAYHLLKADFDLPPVDIHLHKSIPVGAGLGGGSSDAAATLRALNEEFRLGLSEEKLEGYAGKLGSDCPFFIRNKAVFATQTGTSFEEIELDLKGWQLLVVWPALHISTARAYQSCIPRNTSGNLKALIHSPLDQWQNLIENDFEKSLFDNYPVLPKIKTLMYDLGAGYASMSGSGSAMYGIFGERIPPQAEKLIFDLDPRMRIYHLAL